MSPIPPPLSLLGLNSVSLHNVMSHLTLYWTHLPLIFATVWFLERHVEIHIAIKNNIKWLQKFSLNFFVRRWNLIVTGAYSLSPLYMKIELFLLEDYQSPYEVHLPKASLPDAAASTSPYCCLAASENEVAVLHPI